MMGKYVHEYFELYKENFQSLILLTIIVILPMYVLTEIQPIIFEVRTASDQIGMSVYNVFISVLFATLGAAPLVYFLTIVDEEQRPYVKTCLFFLEYGFGFFVYVVLYSFLSAAGMLLFVLPGIVIMAALFAPPIIMCFKNEGLWKNVKFAMHVTKSNFFKILFMIIATGGIELLIKYGINLIVQAVSPYYATYVLLNLLVSMLLFPFYCCIYKVNFEKWAFTKTFKKEKRIVI
ncbi:MULTISPECIES: hypothetical protein [unclassified Bacillus cereus group]|uniref:hypothetical protein n=1 Tax=unclassified Bacillus cereus group TaxID=2750818 RepID=UPI001F57DB56|nr:MULTISPECIES: hypothetical protein [unclassified Bacillus cereus group]